MVWFDWYLSNCVRIFSVSFSFFFIFFFFFFCFEQIEKESIKRKGLLSKDFADTCRLICVLLGIIVESRRLLIKEIIFFFYFPCNIYAFVIIRIHTFCTFI